MQIKEDRSDSIQKILVARHIWIKWKNRSFHTTHIKKHACLEYLEYQSNEYSSAPTLPQAATGTGHSTLLKPQILSLLL